MTRLVSWGRASPGGLARNRKKRTVAGAAGANEFAAPLVARFPARNRGERPRHSLLRARSHTADDRSSEGGRCLSQGTAVPAAIPQAYLFALSDDDNERTRFRKALQRFPAELPYEYEEQKADEATTAAFGERAAAWAKFSKPTITRSSGSRINRTWLP